MSNVVDFVTPKRNPPVNAKPLCQSAIKPYLSLVADKIAAWQIDPWSDKYSEEQRRSLSEANPSLIMSCLEAFVSSNGQWRGRWPRFGNSPEDADMYAYCLFFIGQMLGCDIGQPMAKAVISGYQSAIDTGGKPHFEFESDPDAYFGIRGFLKEMEEEAERQSRILQQAVG